MFACACRCCRFDFFCVFQQLLPSYAKFTGNDCGFLASSNAEARRKTPPRRHKWNPAIAGLKILRDFIITTWITFGLYMWDGHLMGRKRVRDTQGPVSNHPVSTAATYSSPSSAPKPFPSVHVMASAERMWAESAASSQVSTTAHSLAGCFDL